MCPCILFDKLKRIWGVKKKSNRSKESKNSKTKSETAKTAPTRSDESQVPGSKEKDRSDESKSKSKESANKSPEEKPSKQGDTRHPATPSSTASMASVTSDSSKEKLNAVTKECFGQVNCTKPNPKEYSKHALEADRPDLFAGPVTLTEEELRTLENYLVQQGEVRIGVHINLGRITSCDNDTSEVGDGNVMTVVAMYAYGRFGSVYLVRRDTDLQAAPGVCKGMALKSSRRMSASAKIEDEIRVLRRLCRQDKATDLKDVPRISHITPLFFSGVSGGSPYLVMPMMDANLSKIRQETKSKITWKDAFYIAQEAMIGIRECHNHLIVHRDIKPTNLLLNMTDNRTWWLCDFGDACLIGDQKIVSPPDAMTLPYLSRKAHRGVVELVPATIDMDIESWFYMVLEFFIPLPWSTKIEEDETLEAKNEFWTTLNTFFEQNINELPPQIPLIAKMILDMKKNEKIHANLQALLRDGFNDNNNATPTWKPFWTERRPAKTSKSVATKAPRPMSKRLKIGPPNKTKSGE
uniref:non-specific serine/threonine protein kinase n=1 Tax=Caenorhabditis japonica TaxID=281687 RepID=A0A8R1HK98_CAEJA